MRDVVICPSFYRPEYLWVCLDHLAKADGGKEKEIYIFQDFHVDDPPPMTSQLKEVKFVADLFRHKFERLEYVQRQPHAYPKNPLNFLEAYKDAHSADDVRHVYLVEDDVMVAKDFFRWHEAIMEKEDPFISVGWHCIRNPEVKKSTDHTGYITSYRDFSSIGLCWKRENLAPLVRHATVDYYSNMTGYLAKAFPNSPVPVGTWTEQAGLITRLLHEKSNERKVVWPAVTRVAHVGVRGYHRRDGHRFDGSLQKRVKDLQEAMLSTVTLNKLGKGCDDVNALAHYGEWTPEQLHVVQHFNCEYGKL